MASSSNIPEVKYDVFLSFRGVDTRYKFTSHLGAALHRKNIQTFIDDELERGERISPSLLKAIEQSKISVIILSENYASSRWCLEELAKILDCKEMFERKVIPIFYDVDPSHVRNQTGAFGDAFAALEKRFEGSLDVLQSWKTALREVANLSGCTTDSKKSESELIEEIVMHILKRLSEMSSNNQSDLIGVESHIKEIESMLKIGSNNDVCIVGIWGIGGIGKTSISSVIFNKYSRNFEGSYFAENVREESKRRGLTYLRKQLFFKILGDKYANIRFTLTKKRLACKKVFIVFDDVTSLIQIENLIEDLKCLGLGSRIIITSRDKQVLNNFCGADKIYKLEGLYHPDALKLFKHYAFRQYTIVKEYIELSERIVTYAKGVPLALKVLGSSLLGKTKQEWESLVNKLERSPLKDIQNVLKISFDGLDGEEKELFLDIACIFKGEDRDFVISVMDSCDYSLSVLVDKSLVIVSYDNKITMHDLLEKMGREIVRQKFVEDPSKCSRLFHHEDIHHVLTKNEGIEAIKNICLDVSQIREIHLTRPFSKMRNLQYLKVYNSHIGEDVNKLYGFQYMKSVFAKPKYLFWHRYAWTALPSKLRYLSWHRHAWKSLPPKFHLENLVVLEMPESNIKQLWHGVQHIVNLKRIDLRGSKRLLKCPDLSLAKNLETLNFKCCTSLIEIHSSIQYLNKLSILNLTYCRSLRSIPSGIYSNVKLVPKLPCKIRELLLDSTAIKELPSSIEGLSKLKRLSFLDCSRLENLPSSILSCTALEEIELSGCTSLKIVSSLPCNLRMLTLRRSVIQELPLSIQHLSKLETLDLAYCQSLERLPSSIGKLKSLERLHLNDCLKLNSLPVEIGNLEALIELNARDTGIREVPSSIVCLNNLYRLSFVGSKGEEHVGLILPPLSGLQRLTGLDLSDCGITELPSSLGQLTSLQWLDIGRNKFESIPASIINLSELGWLDVCDCGVLKSLPEIPSSIIKAYNCKSLELLSGFSTTWSFGFINCFKLDQNALEDIVKSALQNIPQEESIGHDSNDHVAIYSYICFPGNSIPEWCNFRSKGSFIELPSGCLNLNDDVLCLSFCTVLYHHKSRPFKVKNELYHKSDGEQYERWSPRMRSSPIFFGSSIDSEHIFVCYNSFRSSSDRLPINSGILFEFYADDIFDRRLDGFEVKECGVMFLPSSSGALPAKRQAA